MDDDGPQIDLPPVDDAREGGLARVILVALIGGAVVGVVGGVFRVALVVASAIRDDILYWTRDAPAVRWAVPVVLAAIAVGLARLVVRWVPTSSGSGVQRVEQSMHESTMFESWQIVPAKFIGGVLAMGAGLALGREGPTVQMGAAIGSQGGRLLRVTAHDRRTLQAALGGAGLGVAFSAPLGGAVFVFEEVARAIRTRLVIATLVGVVAAMAVARLIVGDQPVFVVPTVDAGPLWWLIPFALLGALVGLLGSAYNRLVLACLDWAQRMPRVPAEAKAAIVGAAVGLLGIAAPSLVGEGEALNEGVLLGRYAIPGLVVILLVRWLLSPASYALGTPGGLFAPLLVIGATIGALFAETANLMGVHLSVLAFGIVGMSAMFTAVVRAPLTGIVLIMEMTATTTLFVPLALAAACAMIVTTLLSSEPVYAALRQRMTERP